MFVLDPLGDKILEMFQSYNFKLLWKMMEENGTWKYLNPIALRKAKIVYNFGLSECNRVKLNEWATEWVWYMYSQLLISQTLISQNNLFYFIPSSDSSAYLKQIKCILSAVKKYRIFSLVTDKIFIFSL